MYQPDHFRVADLPEMHALMRGRPFAVLISAGASGLYNALPPPPAIDDDEREDLRADFGVGSGERLLLLCSARWQHPKAQAHDLGPELMALFHVADVEDDVIHAYWRDWSASFWLGLCAGRRDIPRCNHIRILSVR